VSKKDKVLAHLKKHKSITSWAAIDNYGATRLAAIIFDLRYTHHIDDKWESAVNSEGETVRWKRYFYKGEK
jgi:hypothetical protein